MKFNLHDENIMFSSRFLPHILNYRYMLIETQMEDKRIHKPRGSESQAGKLFDFLPDV